MVTIIDQLYAGLSLAVVLFFAAAGLNLVWGVLGVMNFATGSVVMLGAYLTSVIMGQEVSSLGAYVAALVIVPLVMAAIGGLAEVVLLRRTYARESEDQQFMITLALAYLAGGAILLIFGTRFRSLALPHAFQGSWHVLGTTLPRYTGVTVGIGILVTVLVGVLLYRTRLGLLIRAASSDRGMVDALGVNVKSLYTLIFALGIGLGALGGMLIAPVFAITSNLGNLILVPAFIVVVTGGMGNMTGAMVVSLVIGLLQSLTTLKLPSLAPVTPYAVMIVVLLWRGLMSGRRRLLWLPPGLRQGTR